MEPIRVLCVFASLGRGGAETMCMNLYRKIDRTKVQFDFVKHTHEIEAFEDEIKELGGRIYEAPTYKVYNQFQYLNWWKRHFEAHPEHRIVHGHYFTISALYFSVARKYGRITIGHSHNTDAKGFLKNVLIRKAESQSDYCLACSEAAGKWLFPRRDFTVLKNGVNVDELRFQPEIRDRYRKQLQVDNALVIGVVANFSVAKNPVGVIDIFSAIHQRCPGTHLVWVGEGGFREKIENEIINLQLEDAVSLLGSRADVPGMLQAMDVFMLPSLFEGLPVVLVEAQAAGLPCLCSDRITREIDITGLCRFLDIEKPEDWAEAVKKCRSYRRQDTSKKIRSAGYDVETNAEWLQEFYETVLKK